MRVTETIAAIATATGNSGIGIVRVSGDEAIEICDRIFVANNNKKRLADAPSHTVHYGNIVADGKIIDEVLAIVMKAPNTYTREDTVEIDCHGGAYIVNKVLECVINAGARPAEPGEFTKRAFLNGRIDMSEAEAVIDVINAQNNFALESSINHLKGSVSEKIRDLRGKILYNIAFIESALDDPEHISLDGYKDELEQLVCEIKDELKIILELSEDGRILAEGINTVILGKPNVGKSTLLNVLAGSERAIVTHVAGTTRDVLEEHIKIRGLSLNIADTAGIHRTNDVVEKIGVNKAKEYAEKSDLIIFVADATRPLSADDMEIIDFIRDKKAVILLNKTDMQIASGSVGAAELEMISGRKVISISAKMNTGIGLLKDEIEKMFYSGEVDFNNQVYITNIRQKKAVQNAYESILHVEKSIKNSMPEDFYSIDLMGAYQSLGYVIGEALEDDLIDEIFSRFCMGK